MKTDTVFKKAFNDAVQLLADKAEGTPLPSENGLRRELGVSRTTVRKVLAQLLEVGAVTRSRNGLAAGQAGKRPNPFPSSETVSRTAQLERRFMEWVLRDDMHPGTLISELDLARRFAVATTGIREFLNRFQRFGLIEKRPNAGWIFNGFTLDFALDLFEIREMFELRSARIFALTPRDSLLWQRMDALQAEHRLLLAQIETRFQDFSDLDNRFHRLINSALPNRFIDDFYDIITLIFHYHYQWNKLDERQRNEIAIREHLTYIDALSSQNLALVELACRAHLSSAKETLIRSTATTAPSAKKERIATQSKSARLRV